MVETPADKLDIEDYDDIETYIADAMAEGYTLEAADFEGRQCAYCGETIPFAEFPDAAVTWDVPIQEPGCEPSGYVARHYFCSDDCRSDAKRDVQWNVDGEWHEEPDRIHEDDIAGRV